ncbi:uncharacterized protein LOC112576903 isoform X2 [Pomacea canaliculata]|uniref:uncharacterized protein LOC112576903 isoform X2 n=1 Tax=Pomacea canaliculata TaxID=400727 RepID=UPI000D73D3A2|nr:uncharacterized protein LOC112576903 isoform X2 [Pomacea canaliculata]
MSLFKQSKMFMTLKFRAIHLPIVRSKVMEHVMMWMASNSNKVNHEVFQKVKSLIMTGAADMWSVVRKTCSNGLPKVFNNWTQKQQKHFLTALLEVCINKEGSWQSKDGAALCINSIMHHCYSPKKGGGLPDYVSECVLTVIFSLISHPQLCIRETVANTMSAYVEHVDAQDVKALLHQTLLLLMPSSGESDSKRNMHLQMAEAYTAEGLLNICISILKVLSINQALGLWPRYCNIFLACLSHDASSVRQTTSLLFAHLATRKDSSVVMVKLVLHRLSIFWNVGLDSLACCQDFFKGDSDRTGKWEATEGRMFVYELIFQQLIEDYIATQHNNVHQKSLADDIECAESFKHTNGVNLSCTSKYEAVEECLCSLSWLAQLYLLDNTHLLARTLNLEEMTDKELYELQWWLLTHQTEKTEISDGCEAWYGDKILPSCPELFLTLLHQTAACLAHKQWELRRIAQQILPRLCEVIWLYSTDLMLAVWHYTTNKTCLKSFLGLVMMQHSLAHCAAIISLTDKDGTSSSPVRIDLVESVRKKIKDYLPLIASFLERPVFDKISVTAAEIALLSVTLFDFEESLKMELSEAALHMWKSLFAFAHPSAVTMLVFSSSGTKFSSPSEGFLSCCLVRPESKVQCARQVERTLLNAIHRLLPQFLPSVSVYNKVICLPILAHSVRLFIDDKNICRSLLTSLNILSHCTQIDFAGATNGETAVAEIRDSKTLRCIFYTVWELAHSIAMKSLDQLLLQKVLGSYLLLCGFLDPAHHVPLVLKSICSRLNEGQLLADDMTDRNTVLDVDLHWYIPAYITSSGEPSFASENYDTNMPREKDDCGDSLNTSARSLGSWSHLHAWRRRTLSTTSSSLEIHKESDRCEDAENSDESEEDGSDWDSWSEEEAEQKNSALQTLFRDFLLHLRTMYGQAVEKILEAEREKMTQKESSLLQDLMTVNKNKCKG